MNSTSLPPLPHFLEGRSPTLDAIEPVRIAVPQAELDELHARLRRTRWTSELPDTGWDYGVPLERVRHLVEFWLTRHAWRTWESRLNAHPQFVTMIDRQHLHFLHVRSGRPGAIPLLLLHGWPGSVAEFLDIIVPLTGAGNGRTAGESALVFDLVIPSLPGFGFSGPTRERGWNVPRIARACAALMDRLGYDSYGVFGTDWGSFVAPEIGRCAPQAAIGVHVTQLFSGPIGQAGELESLSSDEAAAVEANRTWVEDIGGAYAVVQAQQPQTLAHALADSPAGLVGWLSQIFRDAGDEDFVVTQAALQWLTGTVASGMRIYREHALTPRPTEPTRVPLALSQFRNDHRTVRRFAERDHAAIVQWRVHDCGGHFAAHQEPERLARDLRDFFGARRASKPR